MKYNLYILFCCFSFSLLAQNVQVDSQTYTPQELIENILIDSNCITNVNVTNVIGGNKMCDGWWQAKRELLHSSSVLSRSRCNMWHRWLQFHTDSRKWDVAIVASIAAACDTGHMSAVATATAQNHMEDTILMRQQPTAMTWLLTTRIHCINALTLEPRHAHWQAMVWPPPHTTMVC